MTKSTKKVQVPRTAAQQTMDSMLEGGLLDELMAQVDSGGLQLTGEGGFLPEMTRRVLEAGLQAELTSHLGYDKHDPMCGRARSLHGSGGVCPNRSADTLASVQASPDDLR